MIRFLSSLSLNYDSALQGLILFAPALKFAFIQNFCLKTLLHLQAICGTHLPSHKNFEKWTDVYVGKYKAFYKMNKVQDT
jgi:hypothetical protein